MKYLEVVFQNENVRSYSYLSPYIYNKGRKLIFQNKTFLRPNLNIYVCNKLLYLSWISKPPPPPSCSLRFKQCNDCSCSDGNFENTFSFSQV